MPCERILHCLTTIVVVATLAGCDGASAGPERSSPSAGAGSVAESGPAGQWEVATVTTQPYTEQVDLPGASVRGFETIRLLAKVGGYVGKIGKVDGKEIDIGTQVKKGTVLVVLDVPEMVDDINEKQALVAQAHSKVTQATAAIKQANAALSQAAAVVKETQSLRVEKVALQKLQQKKFTRIERLVRTDNAVNPLVLEEARYAKQAADAAIARVEAAVASAQAKVVAARADVDRARADKAAAEDHVTVARAQLNRTKTLIGYATIRVPFDGIVTKRLVDHRTFVRPAMSNSGAMPLFEVTQINRVRVVVSVPGTQSPKIQSGQTVLLHTISGLPGVTATGSISRTAGVLDPQSRMMQVEADFSNPLTNVGTGKSIWLRPGMFGTVTVIIKKWAALPIVPTTAVVTNRKHSSYVMVVEAGGHCRRQPVTIVFNDAKTIGISSGLSNGQVVVMRDVARLKNGQTITTESRPGR